MNAPAAPTPKQRFPRAVALQAIRPLVAAMQPLCDRLIVAGSLRRRKAEVGDVEIVYVPKVNRIPVGLFGEVREEPYVDGIFNALLAEGRLQKRTNTLGSEMWGAKNKLARDPFMGVPIDLFAATEANWWNYVVCRTGPGESNIAICNAAIRKGWKWNPYDEGFSRAKGLGREVHAVSSEREVFEWVGLPYREPWERE